MSCMTSDVGLVGLSGRLFGEPFVSLIDDGRDFDGEDEPLAAEDRLWLWISILAT